MIITCEDCNSSFNVNDSLIKESGSKVRCSKCDSVFVAYPQAADNDLALESEEFMSDQDENPELEDLDSSLGDLFGEDEEAASPKALSKTDEVELDLDDFDKTLEPDSETDFQENDREPELDLDFDQDDDSDLALDDDEAADDDLPELGDLEELDGLDDLEALDEEGLEAAADDSDVEDLELELEDSSGGLELEEEDGVDLTGLGLEEEDIAAVEKQPSGKSEEPDLASDLDLGDLDQEDAAAVEMDSAVEGADELDLSDLELALDDESNTAAAMEAKPENLNFQPDAEESLGIEESDIAMEMEEADELDLSDLELDMEDTAESEAAPAAGPEDLDFDLDLDSESLTETSEGEAETESAASEGDELDLSDLTDIMDEETATETASEPEDLDLELELDSDDLQGEDAEAGADDSEGIDELDLSDLGDFMNSEEAPAAPAAKEDASQDLELELDLEMEGSSATSDAAADSGDELDFSDLEQLLESDEKPTIEAADSKISDELELEFDLDAPAGENEPAPAANQSIEDAADDDFLDIEQMLEDGEAATSGQTDDVSADITDLPLEMEAALDDASKGAEAELELDFDLESELQEKEDMFGADSSGDQQLESNLLASDEVDFLEEAGIQEPEFQDSSETSVIGTDDFDSEELASTQGAYGATHVLPSSEEDSAELSEEFYAEEPPARKAKRRSKKPVLVVLLLLVLGVGVVVVPNMLGIKIPYLSDIKIPYLSDLNVKIPYLSDWLKPEAQDVAGNLKLIPIGNTINGKFVNNRRAGQLFVIKGEIKNDYDHPRSRIKVTGKLYQKGNKMAKMSTVYCGNVLSDSDLAAMDIQTIKKRLQNTLGDRRANLKVKTGKMVPFMIVFDNLPKNLDEYSVEVEGSSI